MLLLGLLGAVIVFVFARRRAVPLAAEPAGAATRSEPAVMPRNGAPQPAADPGNRRSQAIAVLTDRFVAGALTRAEYQEQVDYVLRAGRDVRGAVAARPAHLRQE